MIYFDNAATSMPKPMSVKKAVLTALDTFGNPGRGGHTYGKNAENTIFDCRCALGQLFNVSSEERIIFTPNATFALNIAIKSLLCHGGHAVISGYEHNSVLRPLAAQENVSYTVAHSKLYDEQDAFERITQAVTADTKCLIVNHISNVFGNVLPIERIDSFCFEKNIPLILDISQSAGCVKIDAEKLRAVHFLCMPGHKGLYGPSGTGVLICLRGDCRAIIQGGTGSNSWEIGQPDFLPDMLESGTPNFVGIAGLLAGVNFVLSEGEQKLCAHKNSLIERFVAGFPQEKGLTLFYHPTQKSLISFTAYEKNNQFFDILTQKGLCLRAGMHCSPLAHKSAETYEFGTIRASFSPFNSVNEVNSSLNIIKSAYDSLK